MCFNQIYKTPDSTNWIWSDGRHLNQLFYFYNIVKASASPCESYDGMSPVIHPPAPQEIRLAEVRAQ